MTDAHLDHGTLDVPRLPGPDPSFLIVGTSRSGTTLIQRLAWELTGVRVPPETHFFGAFLRQLLDRRRFPLDAPALVDELDRYRRMRTSRGLHLDTEMIVGDLQGVCHSPWELFGAIVRQLAGPAEIYGEKTPEHLRCWKALTRRDPALKMIFVVREPRSVVASNLGVPFAPKSVAWLSERWRVEQLMVHSALRDLGDERALALRYEDVVADSDEALSTMSTFLGAPLDTSVDRTEPNLFVPWEWWKQRAAEPIDAGRTSAWREQLTPAQAATVLAICRVPMGLFHYEGAPGRMGGATRQVALSPRDQLRRLHLRIKLARYRVWIERAPL